jgi:hypothetical protein
VDRRAIATARRRRLVASHLEDERGREAALREELEDVVTELEGPAVDAAVLATLVPAEAEVARGVVQGGVAIDLGLEEDFFTDLEDAEPYDPTAELEDEIVRLQELIEESRGRQNALQAYLDALDALPGA